MRTAEEIMAQIHELMWQSTTYNPDDMSARDLKEWRRLQAAIDALRWAAGHKIVDWPFDGHMGSKITYQ